MKKLFLVWLIISYISLSNPHGVTYEQSGGRFGDNIRAFSRALWISYKYNLPLVYSPFEHGDFLRLSQIHEHETKVRQRVKKIVHLKGDIDKLLAKKTRKECLYVIPWHSDIAVDWKDVRFLQRLKKEIVPIEKLPQLKIPPNYHLVAVHVRVGSGHDSTGRGGIQDTDRRFPNKFPPKSFYVDQLRRLSEFLHNEPLYVYVFTDALEPQHIVHYFKEHVGKSNIVYDCKKKSTQRPLDILKDFFSMTQFHYFIRPKSFFSSMADKLSNWKVIMYPESSYFENGRLKVAKVETVVRP